MPTPTFTCLSSDNRKCLDAQAPSRTSVTLETEIIPATASTFITSMLSLFYCCRHPNWGGWARRVGVDDNLITHLRKQPKGREIKMMPYAWVSGGRRCGLWLRRELGSGERGHWEPVQGHVHRRRPFSCGTGEWSTQEGEGCVYISEQGRSESWGCSCLYFPRWRAGDLKA